MSQVSCPKCGSKKVSVYDKEIHAAWSLGVPRIVEYKRGAKETFKECECQVCAHKFRFFPSSGETTEIREIDEQLRMLGKKVKLIGLAGQTIEAEIDGIRAAARINVGKIEVIVDDQLMVTVPAGKMVGGPVLVSDEDNAPVGVLWAGGEDDQGNLHGIVTPIKLWKQSIWRRIVPSS